MSRKKFKFLDVCSGIGAGHEALTEIGGECIGFSEIEAKADKTYRIIHDSGNLQNFGDLMKINTNELDDFDVLIGGFPCQSFSIIGKRKGLTDERGQIIYGILKILKEKRVKYFILENVKGLTHHDKGNTMRIILELLDDAGYKVESRVLKSSDYNIPQIRERIYFVGVRKDISNKAYIFPEIEEPKNKLKKYLIDDDISMEFNKNNKGWNTFISYLNNKYNKGKYTIDDLQKKDYIILDTRQSDLRIYPENCPTLRTGRHGILYTRGGIFRRLSGYEALLLQGFPKEKALKAKIINNTVLLSQAGNAFTVDVIKKIAEGLPL